jgi:hypothetical protein
VAIDIILQVSYLLGILSLFICSWEKLSHQGVKGARKECLKAIELEKYEQAH